MEIVLKIKDFFQGLTNENIALVSILATVIIFLLGQRADRKTKQFDKRKEEYKKFILFLQESFSNPERFVKMDDKLKDDFFDMGASLLLYGSNKVYKKYILFRTFSTHPIIKNSKHNTKYVPLYIIADILKTIRKEIGLNGLMNIESNEVLAFFINDINKNPYSKVQEYKTRYDIFMLNFELFMVDVVNFVLVKKIYYLLIKPIFGLIVKTLFWIIFRPLCHFFSLFIFNKKSVTSVDNSVRFKNQMNAFSFLWFFFSILSFALDLYENITFVTIYYKRTILFWAIPILLCIWLYIDKKFTKGNLMNPLWASCNDVFPVTTIILHIIFYSPIEKFGIEHINIWGLKSLSMLFITIISFISVKEKLNKYNDHTVGKV